MQINLKTIDESLKDTLNNRNWKTIIIVLQMFILLASNHLDLEDIQIFQLIISIAVTIIYRQNRFLILLLVGMMFFQYLKQYQKEFILQKIFLHFLFYMSTFQYQHQTLCQSQPTKQQEDEKMQKTQYFLVGLTSEYQYRPNYQFIFQQITTKKLLVKVKQQKLRNFFQNITRQYQKIPYHNKTHALDVAITSNKYILQKNLDKILQISNFQRGIMLIAAYSHDVGHNGFTNSFHAKTRSNLAQQFNDKSILQNYHAYLLFKTAKIQGSDIFSGFSQKQYTQTRKLIIGLILATDNYYHHAHHKKLKQISSKYNISQWSKPNFKPFFLEIILHSADLSSATKPLQVCLNWTSRINQEFFNQGDQLIQLGFQVDQQYQRKSNIKKNQLSFLNHMIIPFYKTLYEISPDFSEEIKNIEQIKRYWQNIDILQSIS